MKNHIILAISVLLISSSVLADSVADWQVTSTESQFAQTGITVYKSSQSNSSVVDSDKHAAAAKVLVARPQAKSVDTDFWVYDAWVEFSRDDDHDGYFSRFSLEIDADTEYNQAQVYARLYLAEGEVFKEFHTTANFTLYADSSDDSLVVESELLTGFPSSDYEILIELYDAYTDELVVVYDGNNDADLYLLPLESQNYETNQTVIVHEHAGSVSLWGVALLVLVLFRRKTPAC